MLNMELLINYSKCAEYLPNHDVDTICMIRQLFSVQIFKVSKHLETREIY